MNFAKIDIRDWEPKQKNESYPLADVLLQSSALRTLREEICESIQRSSPDSLLGSHILVRYLELLGVQWMKSHPDLVSSTEITDVVEMILDRIPDSDIEATRQVLMWLSCACRSLQLDELKVIMRLSKGGEREHNENTMLDGPVQIDDRTGPSIFDETAGNDNTPLTSRVQTTPRRFIDDLNESLRALIKIERNSVCLIDDRVRGFILRAGEWEWYSVDGTRLWELCRMCLSFISRPDIQEALNHLEERGEILDPFRENQDTGFLKYAVKYWPEHYLRSIEARSLYSFFSSDVFVKHAHQSVLDFLRNEELVRKWSEFYWQLEDPFQKQYQGIPTLNPLHISCCFGFLQVVEKLIPDKDASSKILEQELLLAFKIASRNGHDKILEYLLSMTKFPFSKIEPCVLEAAESGHEDIVLTLLRQVNNASDLAHTHRLLCLSAENGHLEVIRYLLESLELEYEDPSQTNLTPIHHASSQGHVEIIDLLGKERALKASQGKYSVTPLQLALAKGHLTVVEKLLEFGVDPAVTEPNLLSVLHLAAEKGYHKIIEKLLEYHPSLDDKDHQGRTALLIACSNGLEKTGKMLIEKGANPNIHNDEKNTALHLAAEKGQMQLIQSLLQKGAHVRVQNSDGDTALHLALRGGYEEIARTLVEHFGAANKPTPGCIVNLDAEKKEIDPETNIDLNTPLAGKEEEKTEDKSDDDPETGFTVLNISGETPLVLAIENNMSKVATMILRIGKGNVALVPHGSRPKALKKAAETGYAEVVKLLLEVESSGIPKIKKPRRPTSPIWRVDRRGSVESRDYQRPQVIERVEIGDLHYRDVTSHHRHTRQRENLDVDDLLRRRVHSRPLENIERRERTIVRERDPIISRPGSYDFEPLPPPPFIPYPFAPPPPRRRERARSDRSEYLEWRPLHSPSPPPAPLSPQRHVRFEGGDSDYSDSEDFVVRRRVLNSTRDSRRSVREPTLPVTLSMIARARIRSPEVEDSRSDSDSSESESDSEGYKIPLSIVAAALDLASTNGHAAVVTEILNARPKLKSKSNWFAEYLSSAINNGHHNVVKLLVGSITPRSRDSNKEEMGNCLRSASKLGHTKIVKTLLNIGVDVNSNDINNNTALQLAAYFGKPAVVRLLLLRRADVTLVDSSGSSALSDAAYRNSQESLELLLEAGANIETRNKVGDTPLMRAVQNGSRETVELLLEAGADIEAGNRSGETPLSRAAKLSNIRIDKLILLAGSQRKLNKSLDKTGREGKQDETWNNSLIYAVRRGDEELVQLLIDNGADVKAINATGGRWGSAMCSPPFVNTSD